uniref:Non-haem dioxygenase N-terminal domain-containing protein n=1 Tax=Ananas comosus var. bracteatus TaxID=296719 RepID=A0A6V7QDB7_ANACO|nr:unnamed protein product [Ananas comosus var. bracteatus]
MQELQKKLSTPHPRPLTTPPPSTLNSLSKACKEWGYFHISNHGISTDLYRQLRAISLDVFNLPLDTKLKASPRTSVNTYTIHFETLRVSGPDYLSSAKSSSDALFETERGITIDLHSVNHTSADIKEIDKSYL